MMCVEGFTLAVLLTSSLAFVSTEYYLGEVDLIPRLLENYRPDIRPVRNFSDSLGLRVSTDIRRLEKLDEQNEILYSTLQITLWWTDEYLKWNISNTNNIYELVISTNKIWTPSLVVTNCVGDKDQMYMTFKDLEAQVYPNGDVMVTYITAMKTACNVNVKRFPFDKQICEIYMAPNKFSNHIYLETLPSPATIDDTDISIFFTESTEWKNLKYNSTKFVTEILVDTIERKFDSLLTKIEMERNPVFYCLHLMVPSILMAFLSCLVFLLPPESGERIGLSVTVLLSYTVFLLTVSDITPRGGTDTSLLVLYITIMEGLSAIILVATVLLWKMSVLDDSVPEWINSFCYPMHHRVDPNYEKPPERRKWKDLSKRLDKIAFGVTLAFVITTTLVFHLSLVFEI